MSATTAPIAFDKGAIDIGQYLVLKTIVGEVNPTFSDALNLRKDIFCKEHNIPLDAEVDGWDAVSIHIIAYLDEERYTHAQQQLQLCQKLAKDSGLPLTAFKPVTLEAARKMKGEDVTPKLPKLTAIGTLRLRRVTDCSHLGKLRMTMAKVERLCVRQPYRRQRVGDVLMDAAEKTVGEAFHLSYIMVHAHVSAKQFYENRGYKTGPCKGFEKAGVSLVVVFKELTEGATKSAKTTKPRAIARL